MKAKTLIILILVVVAVVLILYVSIKMVESSRCSLFNSENCEVSCSEDSDCKITNCVCVNAKETVYTCQSEFLGLMTVCANPSCVSFECKCVDNECVSQTQYTSTKKKVVINLGSGISEIPLECYQFRDNNFDPYYIENLITNVIEGSVKKVESKWKDEEGKQIVTYTDFTIENYVKGGPLLDNEIQFVSLGGTIGNTTQWVEDSPIFTEGKRVRIYMKEGKSNNEIVYGVVCSQLGIREI